MLIDEFEAPGEREQGELHEAYLSVLAETIDRKGVDEIAAETDLEEATVAAVADGDRPQLTLADAAAILATDPDRPDAEAIVAEALDMLLMGMSTAVLDVEAIQSGIDGAMDAKEIQQKTEGRYPITLEEYALLHGFIEGRKP